MTITMTTAKSRYAGDGGTTSFPTGFKFLDNRHIRVLLLRSDGSETLWTEGSEFSLSGAGAPGGGTVAVSTSPTDFTPQSGETLVIKLAIPAEQQTALPLGGTFPSTAVEGMADLAALRDQQLDESLSRALKFKETTALADVEYPEPEGGKVARWNAAGTALENSDLPTFLDGGGAPAGSLGSVDDRYIDNDTGDYYKKTGASTWTLTGNFEGPQGATGGSGPTGADGADGNTVLNGSGTPGGGLGVDGDFYIDASADAIYGPKAAGAWGGATSLVGPQGATGSTGPQGPQGAPGIDGADGVFSQIASQAEAEAGVENTKGMTPLRVAQAVSAQAGGGTADNSITNAKLADVATATLKGRSTAGTGDPEDLTAGQARTLLNVADGANNYSHPNHTGDVTSTGDGATTIANNAVTNAKAADMAQATIKGRASGAGTGDPTDLTPAEARAVLNVADGAEVNPSVVSQAEAEAGTATTERIWTAQRVAQAISALASGGGGSAAPTIIFTALHNVPPSSSYATLDSRNDHPVLDFDDTTNESAVFGGVLPSGYSGGGLTVELHYAMTSATSGDIDWDVAIERIGDQQQDLDADGFAAANSVNNTTVPATSGLVDVVTVTFTNGADMDNLAAGEAFRLRVTRDAASDTATGDAELLAVHIRET